MPFWFHSRSCRRMMTVGLVLCVMTIVGGGYITPSDGPVQVLETKTGQATYYADMFQGGTTASGHTFDNGMLGAAHRTYPFGTVVRVTNLRNGRSINVTIVDRGPYGRNYREGAIIDVSQAAAEHLDFVRDGQVEVQVEVLLWGDGASAERN